MASHLMFGGLLTSVKKNVVHLKKHGASCFGSFLWYLEMLLIDSFHLINPQSYAESSSKPKC
jgi:hypothetical protein